MLPTWSDEYSIHYKRVDKQHKKLFELARKAYMMSSRYISKEEIRDILNAFFDYMKVHFKDEEDYMLKIGYPGLNNHRKTHQQIIDSLVELVKTIHNANDMKEKLSIIAKNWLLEHILQEDMKIALWRRESILAGKAIKIQEEEKFYYVCGCYDKVHIVKPEIHEKIQNGANFRCKKCNQIVKYHKI